VADDNNPGRIRDEADRYRQAAEDALEQLDWCIGYLHATNHPRIAAALARNRSYIRERLLDRPAEPTPSHPVAQPSRGA